MVAEGVYPQPVSIDRDLLLSGGWDQSFSVRTGVSTVQESGDTRPLSVVTVAHGVAATIEYLMIRSSREWDDRGGVYNDGGFLTLRHCTITENVASSGGGIQSFDGTLTLEYSTVSDNWGDGAGGINASGTVTIISSVVSDNWGYRGTGGVHIGGMDSSLTIVDSTVSGNDSNTSGGGISVGGRASLIVENSTISGNSANFFGGGIQFGSRGAMSINNSTIAFNRVGYGCCPPIVGRGGGINVWQSPALATLTNTIVAANTAVVGFEEPEEVLAASDCYSPYEINTEYSLIGDSQDCSATPSVGDLFDVDPGLEPLADNGGPTPTHALSDSSVAVDAGNPAAPGSGAGACLATDQRGVSRPQGTACDMGAYERVVSTNAPPTAGAGPDRTVEGTLGGTSVTLDGSASSDPDGDPLTYTWTGGFNGGTATGPTPTVTFDGLGIFEVTLTVDDGNGGTDRETVTIRVVEPDSVNVNGQVEIVRYRYKMTSTHLTITARFRNTSASCLWDLRFPLADRSWGNFDYSEVVATSAQLGGDGMLCPGETTEDIVFSVRHKGKRFAFFVDAYAKQPDSLCVSSPRKLQARKIQARPVAAQPNTTAGRRQAT